MTLFEFVRIDITWFKRTFRSDAAATNEPIVFERFLLILNIHKLCNPTTKQETNILNGMKIEKMVLH